MRVRALVAAAMLVAVACGSDSGDSASPTTAGAADPASVTIPDSSGKAVAPQPNPATDNPAKAWIVPDATGTDWVSAADALYLAAARPAVPYRGDATVTNATLIALGKKACALSDSYTAGGVTVTGAGARAVHDAAAEHYC